MSALFATEMQRISATLKLIGARSVAATGIAMKQTLDRVARTEQVLLNLGWHPPNTRTGSVPPAPPWRISGRMARQVKVYGPTLFGTILPRWQGKVGPDVPQGRIQELGGWAGAGHRSYLPPRPSLGPAWRMVRPGVRLIFEHELRRAIKL